MIEQFAVDKNYIIGIDEAGRGPLAGPVVVAGIKLKIKSPYKAELSGFRQKLKVFENIRDSKKLSAIQRNKWFSILTKHPQINWAVVSISPKVIDRINIAEASNLGARRVYKKLARGIILPAVLDGSLYLSRKIPHKTVIKGDEKVPVIAAASIIAKVTRDRLMRDLHKKYPQYRFDLHKGYGTKLHKNLIKQLGISKVHRKSFKIRN